MDLRAIGTTAGTVIDTKHVEFTGGVGDTVTMDVFAVVSGYSNQYDHDDFTDYLHGSFLSSHGGLLGDLRAQLVPDYADFIAGNGLRQDLDGDSDLDVGSNNDASLANFFRAYQHKEAPRIPEAKIATVTWTRTGGGLDTPRASRSSGAVTAQSSSTRRSQFRPSRADDSIGHSTAGTTTPSVTRYRSRDQRHRSARSTMPARSGFASTYRTASGNAACDDVCGVGGRVSGTPTASAPTAPHRDGSESD